MVPNSVEENLSTFQMFLTFSTSQVAPTIDEVYEKLIEEIK